jgi:NAD(P)-dependent dehydrogenase (short-subunit alcohol dehydrogenase family)
MVDLTGKKILITGAAKRIGRQFALVSAQAGASVIIHHGHSPLEAEQLADQIRKAGGEAEVFQADFSKPEESLTSFNHLLDANKDLFALVNNAAIFEPVKFLDTSLKSWSNHLDINLTIPFLLSQAFARSIAKKPGRIINILDWRALRPGVDHFPYTISKAALASMTQALALILAPNIQVNGLALGAVLPPSDGNQEDGIVSQVPANRWATLVELNEAFLFLLTGPDYITGEIIHLDGGRHLI